MNESERINRSGDICVQRGQKIAFQKLWLGEKRLSMKDVCDVIPGRHFARVLFSIDCDKDSTYFMIIFENVSI